MFNPLTIAIAGWSEAIDYRAEKFLLFQVGTNRVGQPVTVRTMLACRGLDPIASGRFLMLLPPLTAVSELSQTLRNFDIDGIPCPDPMAIARAALSHAGRVVDIADIYPERLLLARIWRRLCGKPVD